MRKAKHTDNAEKEIADTIDWKNIPRHIAIIMDGNGRWANDRGLPRIAGHRQGLESIRRVVSACVDFGLECLTVYAFSTENWKRPSKEVEFLMNLPFRYLETDTQKLMDNNVKLMISGDIKRLPEKVQEAIKDSLLRTGDNTGLIFNIAINYGGRSEILQAACKLVQDIEAGYITRGDINEAELAKRLYTAHIPDPELLIRTSGEMRISNFLLWQAAYAELYFTSVYWPDFGRINLMEAIREYQSRNRRFGTV